MLVYCLKWPQLPVAPSFLLVPGSNNDQTPGSIWYTDFDHLSINHNTTCFDIPGLGASYHHYHHVCYFNLDVCMEQSHSFDGEIITSVAQIMFKPLSHWNFPHLFLKNPPFCAGFQPKSLAQPAPGFAKALDGRTGRDGPLPSATHPGQVRTRTGDLGRFHDLEIILYVCTYVCCVLKCTLCVHIYIYIYVYMYKYIMYKSIYCHMKWYNTLSSCATVKWYCILLLGGFLSRAGTCKSSNSLESYSIETYGDLGILILRSHLMSTIVYNTLCDTMWKTITYA